MRDKNPKRDASILSIYKQKVSLLISTKFGVRKRIASTSVPINRTMKECLLCLLAVIIGMFSVIFLFKISLISSERV